MLLTLHQFSIMKCRKRQIVLLYSFYFCLPINDIELQLFISYWDIFRVINKLKVLSVFYSSKIIFAVFRNIFVWTYNEMSEMCSDVLWMIFFSGLCSALLLAKYMRWTVILLPQHMNLNILYFPLITFHNFWN